MSDQNEKTEVFEYEKETKTRINPVDFWNQSEYRVAVELPQINEGSPFVFYMRLLMSSEALEARQEFSGLKPGEKLDKTHEYYTNLVALLSTRAPEGLPGFESKETGRVLAAQIREFFAGDNMLKQKLINETIEQYFSLAKRKDFFRGD